MQPHWAHLTSGVVIPLSSGRSPRVARTLMLCAVAAVAATPRPLTAQAKHSITDREFWQLFNTMSEESGSFPSENSVSNEKTYQYVIPKLQRTLTPNGVY